MISTQALEEVIEIASGLKEGLARLHEAYLELPPIIEAEHAAIKASDLAVLDGTRERKEAIGDRVEKHFGAVTALAGCLARFHQACFDEREDQAASPPALGMHACVARLEEILAIAPSEALAAQVLAHLVKGLKAGTEAFEKSMREIQPLVEMNRYLVTRLLENYRGSYLFWQTVAEETQTPYDATGVQRAKGRHSAFAVKA